MKRRAPARAPRNSTKLPISDPSTPMDAANSARDGALAATRITSTSMPEATGMPAESMNARRIDECQHQDTCGSIRDEDGGQLGQHRSVSDDIGERPAQLVEPGVSQDEDGRRRDPQLPEIGRA